MKALYALAFALALALASPLVLAGSAIGPWIGKAPQNNMEGMIYYGSDNYKRAQAGMGAGAQSARWNADLFATSGNGVNVTQNVVLPVGAGTIKSTLLGKISPSAVLGIAGTIVGGPVGLGLLVAAPVVSWLLDANLRPDPVNPGLQFKDPTVCSVAPCYEYKVGGSNYGQSWGSNVQTATASYCTARGKSGCYWANPSYQCAYPFPDQYCSLLYNDGSLHSFGNVGWLSQTATPSPAVWNPISWPAAQPKLSGIPVSVALIQALLDAGYSFPFDQPMASGGPASVSGAPQTTTTTGVDPVTGEPTTTTTTTTTTSTQQYGNESDPATGKPGASISTVTNTSSVTNTTNNTTNVTTTSTSNTTNVASKTEENDPCKLHPDSVGCADLDTPTGEVPRSNKTITYAEENLFGSGSCPANLTAYLGTLGQTVTVWDWVKTCEYALPLRALIMSLAAFAAFLIVMPVKVDV